MALPRALISKQPAAVAEYLADSCTALGWAASVPLLHRVLRDITDAFAGHHPAYRASDMRYHDLGHTLQATVCLADLITGQERCGDRAGFTERIAALSLISALLHDIGFLKQADDTSGTGAKYTHVHEQRSCDFARAYLPTLGVTAAEIELVCGAISCTGPRNRISQHTFLDATGRRMACLLATADYLSQMSAPDYPQKLDALFTEFEEAFTCDGVPPEQRPFSSAAQLQRATPHFWHTFVRPMLDSEAEGVHRFLVITGQTNPYLDAIAANLVEISRRSAGGLVHS